MSSHDLTWPRALLSQRPLQRTGDRHVHWPEAPSRDHSAWGVSVAAPRASPRGRAVPPTLTARAHPPSPARCLLRDYFPSREPPAISYETPTHLALISPLPSFHRYVLEIPGSGGVVIDCARANCLAADHLKPIAIYWCERGRLEGEACPRLRSAPLSPLPHLCPTPALLSQQALLPESPIISIISHHLSSSRIISHHLSSSPIISHHLPSSPIISHHLSQQPFRAAERASRALACHGRRARPPRARRHRARRSRPRNSVRLRGGRATRHVRSHAPSPPATSPLNPLTPSLPPPAACAPCWVLRAMLGVATPPPCGFHIPRQLSRGSRAEHLAARVCVRAQVLGRPPLAMGARAATRDRAVARARARVAAADV